MNIFEITDLYKKEIDKLRPFEGILLEQIKAYYRIGLTWSSNALEGNTYSESETKVLLEDGLTVGGKPLKDTFEVLGHEKAYSFMFTLLKDKEITEEHIITMHRLFYNDIDPEYAGKYRDMNVLITGSNYSVADFNNIHDEMNRLINWIKEDRQHYHPVEFAALLHKEFVFIHPFKDGNGRVARLLMNTALIQDGYMIAIIPPILRNEYISLLEKAHKNDRPFIEFIAERVKESQKEIMRLLHLEIPRIE
ncbi:MAG: Fic family protein [Tissierellia bacterium]|jgi:Fic family protein|nr:Fic family protein [Tissierellia bacterium]